MHKILFVLSVYFLLVQLNSANIKAKSFSVTIYNIALLLQLWTFDERMHTVRPKLLQLWTFDDKMLYLCCMLVYTMSLAYNSQLTKLLDLYDYTNDFVGNEILFD